MIEALPLKHASRWTLYEPNDLSVAKGDMIRITRNTKVHTAFGKLRADVIDQFDLSEKSAAWKMTELANGTEHRVVGFTLLGDIILKGQKILPKSFGHFTHGYCRTGQASQAITTDSAILVGTTDQLAALDSHTFLVAATRAQYTFKIFTDDLEEFEAAAGQDREQVGAFDLLERGSSLNDADKRAAQQREEFERYKRFEQSRTRGSSHEH